MNTDSSTIKWKSDDCHGTGNNHQDSPSREQNQEQNFKDQFKKSRTKLSAAVTERTCHGRRRSESAPDALLDCLHCGKDLVSRRFDNWSPKRSHARRSTIPSQRTLSPVKIASSMQVSPSFKEKYQKPGKTTEFCGRCCPCKSRKGDPKYDEPRRRLAAEQYKTLSYFCANDHDVSQTDTTESSSVLAPGTMGRYGDGISNKPGWKQQTRRYPVKQTAEAGCYHGRVTNSSLPLDRRRTVAFNHKATPCSDVDTENDTTVDDDTEGALTNLNENRHRRSLTSFTDYQKRSDRKLHAHEKWHRKSYPEISNKKRPSSLRVDHMVGRSKEHVLPSKSPRSVSRRRSTGNSTKPGQDRLETKRRQKSTSSEDEEDDDDEIGQTVNDTGINVPLRGHSNNSLLMTKVCDMWRRNRLCDVVLRSNGQEIVAHRLVLAAFSDKFARQHCDVRDRETRTVIDVPDSSAGGIQEVLRFVYTGDIRITADNVAHVLSAALFLHMDDITNMCKQMLLNPDVETVVVFSSLVEKYHISDNLLFFYDFMCKHFLRVSRTRGWRTLTFNQVFDLLSEDNLHVERELDVFHAAVAWIDADRINRLTFAADLIGCVRFAYVTPDEIAKHVETKHFLFQGDEGKELLLCIYRHHALQTCGCQHAHRVNCLPRRKYLSVSSRPQQDKTNSARCPSLRSESSTSRAELQTFGSNSPWGDLILCVGGINPFQPDVDRQARQLEQFNARDNAWVSMSRLPDGRHHHGAVVEGGAIYIIGGSVMDDLNPSHLCNPTSSCYRYDLASRQWCAIAPLNTPRMYHATTVLNGVIYAIAGQTQHSKHLRSVECYCREVDEWSAGVEMGEGRIGVAVIAYKGRLFAVGGFLETQQEHVVRSTVEVFDPGTRKWSALNCLPSPRCHAGLVECRDTLYLVGGSTFPAESPTVCSLATILRYNDLDDRWDWIHSLQTPRHDMGVAVLGSRIFVVGGVSSTENKVLKDVECYDVEGDYWLEDVQSIASPVLGLVCLASGTKR